MKEAKADKKTIGYRILIVILTLSVVGGVYGFSRTRRGPMQPVASKRADTSTRYAPAAQATASTKVPPYHESAEAAKPFPRLVPASYFRRYPLVARAYEIASEIPGVIAQQPCYCYCEKFKHRSLLDCYASDHGAG